MKITKYIITYTLSVTFIFSGFLMSASKAEAYTRSDIDLLVEFELIQDTSLVPLLYLLAEDAPTVEEIIEMFSTKNTEKDLTKEKKETTQVDRKNTAEGVITDAYVKKAQFSGDTEKGIYTIELTLTATGKDIWIEDKVDTSNAGFNYEIIGDNAFVGSSVAFITKSSASTKTNGRYKINEDKSETFKIQVELEPDTTSKGQTWAVRLTNVTFANDINGGNPFTYTLSNKGKFETKKVVID